MRQCCPIEPPSILVCRPKHFFNHFILCFSRKFLVVKALQSTSGTKQLHETDKRHLNFRSQYLHSHLLPVNNYKKPYSLTCLVLDESFPTQQMPCDKNTVNGRHLHKILYCLFTINKNISFQYAWKRSECLHDPLGTWNRTRILCWSSFYVKRSQCILWKRKR